MNQSSIKRASWLTMSALTCAINAAYGQTVKLASSDASIAPVVVEVMAAHYNNSVGSTDSASAGVVLGELLQDRPLLRPGEVLETIPGLVVTQHSGDGKANQYFLRGYNLDHGTDFATSVDGVPVNLPSNAHGQGYADLNFLIPEIVDQIDYRKGTYFAENGDFSAAGSAEIKYRNVLDKNLAELTEGYFGYQRAVFAGSLTLAGKDGQAGDGPALLGALELMQENGPWTSPEGMRKVNAVARMSDGSAASGWSLGASAYQARWNSTDQVPLSLIQSGQLGYFSAVDPSDGGESNRVSLSGEWHDHDAHGYEKASAFLAHSHLQLWSNFTFFELHPATGDQFSQIESRNFMGAKGAKGWNHTLFGFDSVSEVGLQVRHDNVDVGLLDTENRMPFATVTSDMVSETETGAYMQNSTAWTKWFRSVVGLREDHLAMKITSTKIPQNSGSASGSQLSPKLALVFGPWKSTEFFADIGKGFHSNDARGVIDKIDPTTMTPASPAPALVSAIGKEIGMRTQIMPGLQSSLALWSLNSSSELVYNADSTIGSTSANGASRRYGIEWNNHMVINHCVLIDADLAWTHARYAVMNDNGSLGNAIPNAVPKVGTVAVTLMPTGPWTGEVNVRYIGSYPLSQDGTLTGPSTVVTNLRAQRELAQNFTLSLDALNLFNRKYYDIAYEQDYQLTRTSPVVPNGVTVHPGEPRELRLTLQYKF